MRMLIFFFFQAEDGIRDLIVTGVQTCALPIWRNSAMRSSGTPKPPVSTLKPRRTAPSTESGLCAVIQIGGRGVSTGRGGLVASAGLQNLPARGDDRPRKAALMSPTAPSPPARPLPRTPP